MKLAFIGTGKIVNDALYAIEPIENIEKQALFARPHSKEKGLEMIRKYGIKNLYTDYDALLSGGRPEGTLSDIEPSGKAEKADPKDSTVSCEGPSDIDTVYIGIVNSLHYSYAKKALMAGKNVILEKPFTGTYAQAKELFDLAHEKDLMIFEAVTILHNPVFTEMQKNIDKLGTVRMALCNYSQYSSRYDNYLAGNIEHSFDKEFFGGALYDINVYNLHYMAGLFGEPSGAVYYPNIGPNGIDTSGTCILQYGGFSAVCKGAKDSDSECFISIQGEKGSMKISGKPNIASSLTTTYIDPDRHDLVRDAAGAMVRPVRTETYKAPECHHRMTQEFRDFADIIDDHDTERARVFEEETLRVMKILDGNKVW